MLLLLFVLLALAAPRRTQLACKINITSSIRQKKLPKRHNIHANIFICANNEKILKWGRGGLKYCIANSINTHPKYLRNNPFLNNSFLRGFTTRLRPACCKIIG